MCRRPWFGLVFFCLVGLAGQAHAQTTFTVNSTDDVIDGACDGTHCSLEDAIIAANGLSGADIIAFNIAPGGVTHTLTRANPLPTITEAVAIDGYTQPGSQVNTTFMGGLDAVIRIQVLAAAPSVAEGFGIAASNVTIRGLAIANFQRNIDVHSGTWTNIAIAGNFIGTQADGATAMGSAYGVTCDTCAGVTVGGSTAQTRNVISGNSVTGISATRAASTPIVLTVRGNLIGTNKAMSAAVPNGTGIFVDIPSGASSSDRILIGGYTGPNWIDESNVIAGNTSHGIVIQRTSDSDVTGSQTNLYQNFIGTDYDGVVQLGNGGDGIRFIGALRASVFDAVIAYNGGKGVVVAGPLTSGGHGVQIRTSRITSNGGLAIDLADDGRTANDGDDSDTGANDLLNFPVMTTAGVDGATGLLQFGGTVQARANTSYLIAFFKIPIALAGRPNGYEAAQALHTATLTTNASGAATFLYTKANGGVAGEKIVAMLHDNSTRNYSSEVSDPLTITQSQPAITGKLTRDGGTAVKNAVIQLSGAESRTAFTDSSGNYAFTNLAVSGNYTVTPISSGYVYTPASRNYPSITTSQTANFTAVSVAGTYTVNVTHDAGDGVCSPAECTLREALAEANDHPGADTLAFAIPGAGPHVLSVDSFLPNLNGDITIDGYTQPGALANTNLTGGLNGTLRIVLARGGAFASNTGAHALRVIGSNVTIRGLVIAGFPAGAVYVFHASNTLTNIVVTGNYLGTTPDGLAAVPDSGAGVGALSPAGMTIGGTTAAARNLISGNITGVFAFMGFNGRASNVVVHGNLIGTNVTGLAAVPNETGFTFVGGPDTPEADVLRFGGDAPGEANVVSGNDTGLSLGRGHGHSDRDDSDHQVIGNLIGVGADGVTPLGNETAFELGGAVRYRIVRNVIAHGFSGALLYTTPTATGRGVELSENRFLGIAGHPIDLGGDQRTENDADDSDTGANNLQNFPVLAGMTETVAGTTLTGTLTSLPNRTYRIEVFTTGGQPLSGFVAHTFVGSFQVTTGADGIAPLSHVFTTAFDAGEWFVATATDVDAMMTSELAFPVMLSPLVRSDVTVTVTLNGAPLAGVDLALTGDRQATQKTDAAGRYVFDLPVGGSYVLTPSLAGYVFTPASAEVTNLASATSVAFTARRAALYLPEGVTGSFWSTSISLLNATSTATTAHLSFLLPDGAKKEVDVPLAGPGHVTIDPATIEGLESASFSTVIESGEAITVSRTTRWGESRAGGAHAEQALTEQRTSWYFAEGATGCFDLFYLLVNPNASPAIVDITFVRRAPELPIAKRYTIDAFSRKTIRVNEEEGLSGTDVSARLDVANGIPIVAERAMYSSCFGANWRGGHDAAATPAPASEWFFAEGATGSFFDLYLLLANFGNQTSNVEIEYLFDNGESLVKQYDVPGNSRVSIDVANQSPQLSSANVSAIVRSTNAVPVVAERAQWWPHGGWYESHVSAGVVQSGIEWQIAGAEAGGPHGAESFLLIANPSSEAATVQVKLVYDDGTTETLAEPLPLASRSRTTLSLGATFANARDRRFGVVIESLGATPTPIVAELSTYNNVTDPNGLTRLWGAGTNIVATRVR
jgi:CSLREA domain-containing protein